jgi:hypothetical protein
MSKFNLSKIAKKIGFKNYDKMLVDQTKDMNLSSELPAKNINLSMPVKNKDSTIPFETQLSANRDGKDSLRVTEKDLDDGKKVYNNKRDDAWDTSIMPINLLSESYDKKKEEDLKEADKKMDTETLFWDGYVGVQMYGKETKVYDNIPPKASQLPNNPEKFTIEGIQKKISTTLQDADAMLFHIYATAAKEGRDVTEEEKQKISDINNNKIKILSAQVQKQGEGLTLQVKPDNTVEVLFADSVIDRFDKYRDSDSNISAAVDSYYPDLEDPRK